MDALTLVAIVWLLSIIGSLLLAPAKGAQMGRVLFAAWLGGPICLLWLLSQPDVD